MITFKGEGYHLGVHNFDETSGGNPLEFNGLHCVGGDLGYMVYPFYNGVVSGVSFADPVLKAVNVNCWIPWDARYDDFSVVPVSGVVGHPECLETFPCPTLLVPKIFDSGAAKNGNGSSFIATTHSQKVTNRVKDERVAENELSKNLRMGCGFGLC